MNEHFRKGVKSTLSADLSREIQSHRDRICKAILFCTAVIAVPTAGASLYRVTNIGWQPLMAAHVFLTIALWAMVIGHKRIAYKIQASVLVCVFLTVGLTGIFQFGLAAAGVAFLIVSVPLATLLFDRKVGLATFVVAFTGAAFTAVAATSEGFSYGFDVAIYAQAPSSWITAMVGWTLASVVLTASFYIFNNELIEALSSSQQQQRKLEQAVRDLDQSNEKLQLAMNEIATLQGIIPICSYCHSIRDDEGAWYQLETYLSNHSEAQFSHGICPDCNTKVSTGLKAI